MKLDLLQISYVLSQQVLALAALLMKQEVLPDPEQVQLDMLEQVPCCVPSMDLDLVGVAMHDETVLCHEDEM